MTTTTKLSAIAFFALLTFLLIGSILHKMSSEHDVSVLSNQDPIEKIDLSIITSPSFPEKREFSINDSETLTKLSLSFRKELQPFNGTIAKQNAVFAIMYIYKSNKKIEVHILSSIYTGWIMKIGEKTYRNEIVFDIVKRYV